MSSYHDYIVYLWILPAALQLIAPLFLFACWLLIRLGGLLVSSVVPGGADLRFERRSDTRYDVDALGEVVATSSGVPLGRVVNVSKRGICVETLEQVRDISAGELALDLGDRRAVFTLRVAPRWEQIRESGILFGATIIDHTADWVDFITDGRRFVPHYQKQ